MIIVRDLAKFVVFSDDPLSHALKKINQNKMGTIFVLSNNGVLEGVLTDGDFRRWLLTATTLDLSLPASVALNKNYVSCSDDLSHDQIEAQFSDSVNLIPLLDRQNRLVGLATGRQQDIRIGNFYITLNSPSFLIAEIGNNHNGSVELACRLVDEAVIAGADCVKFQMRDMSAVYLDGANHNSEDLGAQYTLDLLSKYQLKNEDMLKVFDYCKEKDILPLCTPWDVNSLMVLENYGMRAYKLASADLTNHELLEALCKTGKPLICSTGMSIEAEIAEAVSILKKYGTQYVLLHCNSTYPAPFKDVNLSYMDRLKSLGDGCLVGYSGHERGYAVAIAAIARGAKVIEKHFTIDRAMEGNDHRVSLLPAEFAEMVKAIREVEESLGSDNIRRPSQGEVMNREILGKSIIASKKISEGETITADHLLVRSPGKGLSPNRRVDLIGLKCKRNMVAGDFFYLSDLEDKLILPRPYKFRRPFGVPVRYHDVASILPKSNFDLLEFHLSYKDLDLNPESYLCDAPYEVDFLVHSPELFAGDHVMDLCSSNAEYRAKSVNELQRVIDVTRRLKDFFPKTERPLIIINAGGFTEDGFLAKEDRKSRYELILDSLNLLDSDGVEIIPQTMPPFPWHFGGQRYHNLFVHQEEIVDFCMRSNMRVCLDISHSKLACNYSRESFSNFLNAVIPHSAHLHVVDATGTDGEGLQIGDGEIDFRHLVNVLDEMKCSASFIPEVWQGHKNDGEGFWLALDKLENFGF